MNKLIALDLEGTLINNRGCAVSPRLFESTLHYIENADTHLQIFFHNLSNAGIQAAPYRQVHLDRFQIESLDRHHIQPLGESHHLHSGGNHLQLPNDIWALFFQNLHRTNKSFWK